MSKDGAVWTLRLCEWLPRDSEFCMAAKRGLDPEVAVYRPPASCYAHLRRRFKSRFVPLRAKACFRSMWVKHFSEPHFARESENASRTTSVCDGVLVGQHHRQVDDRGPGCFSAGIGVQEQNERVVFQKKGEHGDQNVSNQVMFQADSAKEKQCEITRRMPRTRGIYIYIYRDGVRKVLRAGRKARM